MLSVTLASGHIVPLRPLQTVDLKAILSSRSGLKDLEIRTVAQSKDGWAVVARYDEHITVFDNHGSIVSRAKLDLSYEASSP